MSELVLVAKSGRVQGSPASRRLRLEGQVPGVVYGATFDPVSIACEVRELRAAMSKRPLVGSEVTLKLDGKNHQAVVKEIHRHPTRPEIFHIDFQVVSHK